MRVVSSLRMWFLCFFFVLVLCRYFSAQNHRGNIFSRLWRDHGVRSMSDYLFFYFPILNFRIPSNLENGIQSHVSLFVHIKVIFSTSIWTFHGWYSIGSKRRRSQVMYILRISRNFLTYLWDKALISVVRIKDLLAKWLRKKLPLFIVQIALPRHFRTYNIETLRVRFLSDNFSVTFFGVSLFSERVWGKEWPIIVFGCLFGLQSDSIWFTRFWFVFVAFFFFTLTPFAQYFCLFVKLRRHRIIQSHRRGDLCFWDQTFFLRIDQSVVGRGVLYFWYHTLLNHFLLTELNRIFWIGFIWGGQFRRRCNFGYSFVLWQRRWLLNNRLRIIIVRMMNSVDLAFLLVDAFGIFFAFRPNKHF